MAGYNVAIFHVYLCWHWFYRNRLQAFTNLDKEVGGDLAQHVTVAFKIGQSCYQRSNAACVTATVG